MTKQILIDSNFLYAVYNREDDLHERAMKFVRQAKDKPLVPDVILPEVCYLFHRDFGHHRIADFLKAFASSGTSLISIETIDIARAAAIMGGYPSARLDFVDCCMVALAERLNIRAICTFDRRDFSIIMPADGAFLELLP